VQFIENIELIVFSARLTTPAGAGSNMPERNIIKRMTLRQVAKNGLPQGHRRDFQPTRLDRPGRALPWRGRADVASHATSIVR
jgi:hypothetical protein